MKLLIFILVSWNSISYYQVKTVINKGNKSDISGRVYYKKPDTLFYHQTAPFELYMFCKSDSLFYFDVKRHSSQKSVIPSYFVMPAGFDFDYEKGLKAAGFTPKDTIKDTVIFENPTVGAPVNFVSIVRDTSRKLIYIRFDNINHNPIIASHLFYNAALPFKEIDTIFVKDTTIMIQKYSRIEVGKKIPYKLIKNIFKK